MKPGLEPSDPRRKTEVNIPSSGRPDMIEFQSIGNKSVDEEYEEIMNPKQGN